MRHKSQNLYFGASIAMKVENCIFGMHILLFDEYGTDIFALIVGDVEVNSLEESSFKCLLFAEDRVDVVGVLAGCDDSFPCSFEVLFK